MIIVIFSVVCLRSAVHVVRGATDRPKVVGSRLTWKSSRRTLGLKALQNFSLKSAKLVQSLIMRRHRHRNWKMCQHQSCTLTLSLRQSLGVDGTSTIVRLIYKWNVLRQWTFTWNGRMSLFSTNSIAIFRCLFFFIFSFSVYFRNSID